MARSRENRLNGLFPLSYLGVNSVAPQNLIQVVGAPGPTDSKNFYVGDLWLDITNETLTPAIPPTLNDLYVLLALDGGNATWVPFSGGTENVDLLTGNTGGPVGPLAGNINVIGDATTITVAGNPATHTLTISGIGMVQTLTGDIGGPRSPVAGNINIITNVAANNAGATVLFSGAGNTLTLDTTSADSNTFIGENCGNATTTSQFNVGLGKFALFSIAGSVGTVTAVGYGCMGSLTNARNCTAVGAEAGGSLTTGDNNDFYGTNSGANLLTGQYNTLLGGSAQLGGSSGVNYTTNESSNVILGKNPGVVGDQNTLRLGWQGVGTGQQNRAFIAGVIGVTVGSPNLVTIDTGTGQLGVSGFSPSTIVQTLTGDSGPAVTPTAGNINVIADIAGNNAGGTISFSGSGSTLTFNDTDANNNVFIGANAGNTTLASSNNTVVGVASGTLLAADNNCVFGTASLGSATSTFNNSIFGALAAQSLVTGDDNIIIGKSGGSSYTTSESSNIIIGSSGTIADNNTIRIGTSGGGAAQQNLCFIAGINGINPTNVASPVVIANNDQLGTLGNMTDGQVMIGSTGADPVLSTLTAGSGITISNGAGSITISSTGADLLAYTNVNTTPYVVLTTDEYLGVDCSGGAITIQLPNAPSTGRVFNIKDRTGSANTNNITVTTVGGVVLIDGATTYVMNTQYASLNVLFDGSTYQIF